MTIPHAARVRTLLNSEKKDGNRLPKYCCGVGNRASRGRGSTRVDPYGEAPSLELGTPRTGGVVSTTLG